MRFIDEYNKEDLETINMNQYYQNDVESYENKSILWDKERSYRELTKAEISCQLKHIKALELAAVNEGSISLIVEDDVIPSKKNYKKKLEKFLTKDNDWDILFIGEGIGKNFILKKINKKFKIISKEFDVSDPATNCAESYLIKSEAAKKLFENFYPFSLPYDWELAYKIKSEKINVKWLYPPIFFQGSISGKFKSENRIN